MAGVFDDEENGILMWDEDLLFDVNSKSMIIFARVDKLVRKLSTTSLIFTQQTLSLDIVTQFSFEFDEACEFPNPHYIPKFLHTTFDNLQCKVTFSGPK